MTPQERRQKREEEYQSRRAARQEAEEAQAFEVLQRAVHEVEGMARDLQRSIRTLRRAERALPRTADQSRARLQRRARELSGILRRGFLNEEG